MLFGRSIRSVAWVVAIAWISASPAHATVMVEVSLEHMVKEADAIVLGTVVGTGTQMVMAANGLEPHTVTTIDVQRWVKGEGRETVTVRELGGRFQGGGVRIDGTPEYRVGEEVLIFLTCHPEHPDDYRTYGMAQGKLVVLRGAPGVPSMVRRDLSSVAFARWEDGLMTVEPADQGPALQLDAVLTFVSQTLAPRSER